MTINIRPLDRFLRLLAGILLAQLGFFWLAAPWSWLAYAAAAVLLLTAVLRFCPAYGLLGIQAFAAKERPARAVWTGAAALLLAAVLIGGSYASAFLTRKFFLEDFNAMNHFYKQALFLTGKNQRQEALSNFEQWKPAFETFSARYTSYRPYALKGDQELEADFGKVRAVIAESEPMVRTGDLHEAHLALEKVRTVFQDMFKRNGFSMLSVTLVEFHDAMETVLGAATAKDAAGVQSLYPAVSDKLKAVEAEAQDEEIQAIRKALDDVLATAKGGDAEALPAKGDTLKSSFIKVYLKRG